MKATEKPTHVRLSGKSCLPPDPRSPSAGPMPWLRATPAPPEGTRQSPTSSSMSLSPSVGSQSVGSASASQRPGAGPALSPRGRRAVAGTEAGPTPAGSRGSRTRLCVHLRQAAPNQTEAGERDQTCPARARGRRASLGPRQGRVPHAAAWAEPAPSTDARREGLGKPPGKPHIGQDVGLTPISPEVTFAIKAENWGPDSGGA